MAGKYTMLVIYGPTATGKTALAINLAKKFNGELISADSRQVYTGLDIGTGKVNFESKVNKNSGYWIVDGVKINGFDVVDPQKDFNVTDFIKITTSSIGRILKEKKLPIIVGGSGFYIKALTDGFGTLGVPKDQMLRDRLEKFTLVNLQKKLQKVGPQKFKLMNSSDRANPRRLIRAIEVSSSGQSAQKMPNRNPLFEDTIFFGLTAPNNFLYEKADAWLKKRLERGLVAETRKLLKGGVDPVWLESLGLEYRWVTRYLQKEVTLAFAASRLKGEIHSFIRRQKAWLKQFETIELFDISSLNWQKKLEKRLSL